MLYGPKHVNEVSHVARFTPKAPILNDTSLVRLKSAFALKENILSGSGSRGENFMLLSNSTFGPV